MGKLRVAAVIPVHNRPTLVLEALDSVALQTRPPDRLVVVDDGSTDETPDEVERWQARHGGMLVRLDHGNASRARNRGAAEAADCDLIAFLDSDDFWPRDFLARMEAAFVARPEAVAACTDQVRTEFHKNGKTALRSFADIPERATAYLLSRGPTGTCSTVLRADAFRAVGGFDEELAFGEDFLLYLKLSRRGAWLHVGGEPVAYRVGVAAKRGERRSLFLQAAERRLAWAQLMQRFVDEEGSGALADDQWKHPLGRAWFKAGQELFAAGERRRAHKCFAHAVALRPGWLRARLRRLFS